MKKKSLIVNRKTNIKILNYLKDPKIHKIYIDFKKFIKKINNNNKLAVAVSGGPDSMALAYLSKCLSLEEKIEVKFYIVDHKLRENSSTESNKVRSILKKLDTKCHILKWNSIKPKSNIQSIARDNRYKLLTNACKKNNINNLLFGHHADDLNENFFIRLFRGSGLKGLTSFNEISYYKNTKILILRPLIKFQKNELVYISEKVFRFYVKDPTNKNFFFQRSRIRDWLINLDKEGFDKKKLSLTIKNLKSSNETINFYVDKNIKDNSKFFKNKNTFFLNKEFFNQSEEVMFRSLSSILQFMGKKYYPSRGKSISSVIFQIKSNKLNKLTLGGCCIKKVNESIIITKEY